MAVQNITTKYDIQDSDLDKLDAKFDGLIKKNKALEGQVAEVSQEFTKAARSAETFGKDADNAANKATGSLKQTERQGGLMGNTFKSLGGIIAGVFVVDKILQFGAAFVDLVSTTKKTANILANQLGSQSAAQKALIGLNQLARDNKIPLDALTDSYLKLVSRGIKPTQKELLVFSDIANSTGKSMDQLIEAVLDAQTGEFERLKEFGIKARVEGDKVKFMFKDVETTVSNTSESIKAYLIGLGDIQGVSGATEAATKGINAELIGFGNNMDAIGKQLAKEDGVFTKGLALVNDYLAKMAIALTSIEDLKLEKSQKSMQEYLNIIGDTKSMDDFAAAQDYLKNKIQEFQKLQAKSIKEQARLNKEGGGFGNDAKGAFDKQKLIFEQAETEIKGLQDAYEGITKRQEDFLNPKVDTAKKTERLGALGIALKEQAEIQKTLNSLNESDLSKANFRLQVLDEEIKRLRELGQVKKVVAAQPLYDKDVFGQQIDEIDQKNKDFLKNQRIEKKDSDALTRLQNHQFLFDLLEDELEAEEQKKEIKRAAFDLAVEAGSAFLTFRGQQLDDELGMFQALKEGELLLAGDNAAARAEIEQEYAEKEKEIKRKQAVNDRLAALFNIAINTAVGVSKAVAESPLTFGLPFSAFALATGLIQAGLVVSRPIPQFFKGTNSSPEGFAWVGERGAEGKITPDGRFSMIPGGAHIDYLQAGTKIIPNHQLSDFVGKEINTPNVSSSNINSSGIDIHELGNIIGSQLSKVTVQQDVYDEKGYRSFVRSQNQRKERLERKNRFNRSL